METKKEAFINELYTLMLVNEQPVKTTWGWHKVMYGTGYDRPEGYQYRKLLMALNELRNQKKIHAIRTNEDTVWFPPVQVKPLT